VKQGRHVEWCMSKCIILPSQYV